MTKIGELTARVPRALRAAVICTYASLFLFSLSLVATIPLVLFILLLFGGIFLVGGLLSWLILVTRKIPYSRGRRKADYLEEIEIEERERSKDRRKSPRISDELVAIAVLPFENMSGDPEQEYFADGITDDIITGLSYLRGLFVIARHSVFVYKGKPSDIRQISRELGVRYILEGGVRRVGEQVRVTTQLVDGHTGDHLWVKRFDRKLSDIFAVQDEITRDIVAELDVKLIEGEQAEIWRSTTNIPDAYDLFLRGREEHLLFSKEHNAMARQHLEQALELDPRFTMAIVQLGRTYFVDAVTGWSDSPAESRLRALELANRALSLNRTFGDALTLLGQLHMYQDGQQQKGIAEIEKAAQLNPNNAIPFALLGTYLGGVGRAEEALEMIRKAFRLNPFPPDWFYNALGDAYFFARRFEEAISSYSKCILRIPDFIFAHVMLTAAYAAQGFKIKAQEQAKEVLRINPRFTCENSLRLITDPKTREWVEDLLNRSGLK